MLYFLCFFNSGLEEKFRLRFSLLRDGRILFFELVVREVVSDVLIIFLVRAIIFCVERDVERVKLGLEEKIFFLRLNKLIIGVFIDKFVLIREGKFLL